jgi:hypothetical protein
MILKSTLPQPLHGDKAKQWTSNEMKDAGPTLVSTVAFTPSRTGNSYEHQCRGLWQFGSGDDQYSFIHCGTQEVRPLLSCVYISSFLGASNERAAGHFPFSRTAGR